MLEFPREFHNKNCLALQDTRCFHVIWKTNEYSSLSLSILFYSPSIWLMHGNNRIYIVAPRAYLEEQKKEEKWENPMASLHVGSPDHAPRPQRQSLMVCSLYCSIKPMQVTWPSCMVVPSCMAVVPRSFLN